MFQEIRKGTKLMRREPLFDLWILLITLILVMIGLIMVFSTSSILAQERYDDAYYFIKKQIIYVVLGLGLLVTLMNIDYHSFKKPVYLLLGIAFILLILVLIPGIGVRVAGARRWINIGIMRFQPAELLKLSLVIWLAYSLDKKGDLVKSFKFGVFPHLLVTGIFIFLLLMQPDFGTAAVLGLISVGLSCWISGRSTARGVFYGLQCPLQKRENSCVSEPMAGSGGQGISDYTIFSGVLFRKIYRAGFGRWKAETFFP